jgi:hypothetical protein
MSFLSGFLTSAGRDLPGIGAAFDKSRMDRRKILQEDADRRKQDILDQLTMDKMGLDITDLTEKVKREKGRPMLPGMDLLKLKKRRYTPPRPMIPPVQPSGKQQWNI